MIRLSFLLLLLLSTSGFADIILVHVGGSQWKQVTSFDELPANAISRVVRVAVDTPDPPTPPNSLKAKVEQITKETITKKLEATALQSIVRLFKGSDLSKFKQGMTTAIEQLTDNPLFPDNEFSEWWSRVEPLLGATVTESTLSNLQAGLTSGTTDLAVEKQAVMLALAATGDPDAMKAAERLDIGSLLELIRFIFELLRDLGIFGG